MLERSKKKYHLPSPLNSQESNVGPAHNLMCGIHLPTTGTYACHLHRPSKATGHVTHRGLHKSQEEKLSTQPGTGMSGLVSALFFFFLTPVWGPPFFDGRLASVYKSERKEALWRAAARRHRQKARTQQRARVEIRREPSDFYPFHSTSSSLLSLRNIVLEGK